jgi:cytochrome P450
VYTHRYTHEQLHKPIPDPRWADFDASEAWSLLNLEPPDHTRLRLLLAKVFTPSAVTALRPAIEATAQATLAPLMDTSEFDVISQYAQPYSVAVICDMLGVPRSDTRLLLDWSHAIVKMYELTTTDTQRSRANQAAAEFIAYVRDLIATKRAHPDDDVVIAGQRLRVGDEIAMLFGAANHDPRQFSDPERFDIGRGDTTHVGFGGGLHFCIGAPLARLEIEVSLQAFARRFAQVQPTRDPAYHPTFVIRGLTAFHMAVG